MDGEKMEPVFSGGEVITLAPTGEDLAIAWARGSRFGKADPEACYAEVMEVVDAFNGTPPNGALIEKAKDKNSAMHVLFDWEDKEAAYKWRVHTERQIKAQLCYVHKGKKVRKVHQIRALTNIKETTEEGEKITVIYNTFEVLKDPEKKKQLVERARRDMMTFKNRYELLEELSSVIDPIKTFLDS